jgi:hypothetical protein
MAQGQKYGYWQGNAGPVGPPPGFMEAATSGGRALARGIESASKSISDAIKEKDEEEKMVTSLAKAGDTALAAIHKKFPDANVYGELGKDGYSNLGAEDRLAHYKGQTASQEMVNQLLTQRATTARTAASDQSVLTGQQQVASSQHAMDQDADTAAGVKSVFNQMSQPTQNELAEKHLPPEVAGMWAQEEPSMEQRKLNAFSQAANANPNMDWAGAASALDKLLPEQKEQKNYGKPGTMTPILGPDGQYTGKDMYWQSSSAGTPHDSAGDGEIEVQEVAVPGSDEKFKVVVQNGKVVPSATTALHRGSGEKNAFERLDSKAKEYVSGRVKRYWGIMRERSLLEKDMADRGRTEDDDVYATDGTFPGRDPSYAEKLRELDNKMTELRETLLSYRILPDDFDREGNYKARDSDMSFDAFRRENQ